ncbi:hemerythrin domain-containing protein [Brevibacillus laterosporus]|uniref:hemerythrin domain-containing protein n=1 Tax=Brevibacillus laterosporus TaxID=1465 RepID=UPI000EB40FE5|nr:hemerythrin domain-containing protein [Brevibacillus laterosporus]AYK05127.1 hemerythrin domain-containing protein [Brevibacillus laterosporus]
MTTPIYKPQLDMTDWTKSDQDKYNKLTSIIDPHLHSFVAEHAMLENLMDKVREGYDLEVYRLALQEIKEELEHHFLYEETFILGKLQNHIAETEVGPIAKLVQDHVIIRKHYNEAKELFEQEQAKECSELLLQKMNFLAYLLKKHIEKEDHYIFPLVSLVLSEEEKKAIAEEVRFADLQRQI